ncbi:hypothetical protein M404DRAFT_30357 [Pisolithus tinctorius Marx 270]|uniref:Uncharacterized protein n=1 Tax=Pisolithus tinctorius Marx 270 TaxID=870435 RepID=A0A0C3IRD2_PISTI|nr:hypothetical protein M404DRAFT_30357 [Pisolithus tinctorius Marx 270]
MSANHLPHLSQLICMATPDPIKVEKATLKEKFIAVSAAMVAKAKCLLDDKEELQEEWVMWMHWWEEKTAEVFPIIKCRWELTKVAVVDGPTVAKANEVYEKWAAEEITTAEHEQVDKDV